MHNNKLLTQNKVLREETVSAGKFCIPNNVGSSESDHIYLCFYVMTVGFSLPVKSFSFDMDNAKSKP